MARRINFPEAKWLASQQRQAKGTGSTVNCFVLFDHPLRDRVALGNLHCLFPSSLVRW